jgi:hypothetical protein
MLPHIIYVTLITVMIMLILLVWRIGFGVTGMKCVGVMPMVQGFVRCDAGCLWMPMKHPGHTYGGFIPTISEWVMTRSQSTTCTQGALRTFWARGLRGIWCSPLSLRTQGLVHL